MLASPTSAMMRESSPMERSARNQVNPMTTRAKARITYRILFRTVSRNVLAAMESNLRVIADSRAVVSRQVCDVNLFQVRLGLRHRPKPDTVRSQPKNPAVRLFDVSRPQNQRVP